MGNLYCFFFCFYCRFCSSKLKSIVNLDYVSSSSISELDPTKAPNRNACVIPLSIKCYIHDKKRKERKKSIQQVFLVFGVGSNFSAFSF